MTRCRSHSAAQSDAPIFRGLVVGAACCGLVWALIAETTQAYHIGPTFYGSCSNNQKGLKLLDNNLFMPLAPSKGQLTAGTVIELTMEVGNHGGHLEVELCDNPGRELKDDCFTTKLLRLPHDTRFSPYDPFYPTAFFVPRSECFLPGNLMKGRFLVPVGVATDHGVLRYNWQPSVTCNSHPALNPLNARITDWVGQYDQCTVDMKNAEKDLCGTECPGKNCRGESYTGCADVEIVSGAVWAPEKAASLLQLRASEKCVTVTTTECPHPEKPRTTTKPPTQPPTQAPTQAPTQPPTQPPTQAPTQAPKVKPAYCRGIDPKDLGKFIIPL